MVYFFFNSSFNQHWQSFSPFFPPSQSYRRSLTLIREFHIFNLTNSFCVNCILVSVFFKFFNGDFKHCFLSIDILVSSLTAFRLRVSSFYSLAIFFSSIYKKYFCLAPFTLRRSCGGTSTSSAFKLFIFM